MQLGREKESEKTVAESLGKDASSREGQTTRGLSESDRKRSGADWGYLQSRIKGVEGVNAGDVADSSPPPVQAHVSDLESVKLGYMYSPPVNAAGNMIVAGNVKDGKVITNGGTVAALGAPFGISGSGSGATTYGNGTLIANGTVSLGDQSGLVAGDAAVKFNVLAGSDVQKSLDGTKADAKPAVALHYFQPTKLAQGLHGKAEAGWDESGKKLSAGTLVLADTSGEADKNKPAEGKPPVTPPANSQSATPTTPVNTQQEIAAQQQRKIIRNGEMEFEVDSFDSAFLTVNKIVTEEGGFVSSTSSEKIANGKVRGTVAVRVPPDHLDALVMKLRALGDLKSQRITAQDVTKVYYDMESELKADRAMEERLLNIIKSGKGEIKDLLEAEKQLGVYRVKIEKLEGEVRYYNNLVALSTLSITMTDRDIKAAAFAAQTELVSMGIETEDVEKSRTDALKAIDEAKGRVIESNLKKDDAGQLAATVVCEVKPDDAGPLIDRLRQLGRVSRMDIDRKQTTPDAAIPAANMRVERKDTRFFDLPLQPGQRRAATDQ